MRILLGIPARPRHRRRAPRRRTATSWSRRSPCRATAAGITCTVDGAGRRVYVSHGNQVDVIDADSNEVAGTIADLKGVHGIAVAPDLGRGFISNGRGNNVTIFDLKTLKPIGDPVATGKNPDAILYDPSSKRVFAFNGRDGTATVIDAAEGKVLGHHRPGRQAGIRRGRRGRQRVRQPGGQEHDRQDRRPEDDRLGALAARPRRGAVGLAIDAKSHRLFIGCHNKMMVVVNAETGKVVDHQPIGQRRGRRRLRPGDGPRLLLLRRRHGDGHSRGRAGQVRVVETVKTKEGSRTMALDPKTHDIFLPSADFAPNPNGGRPSPTAGTFAVLLSARDDRLDPPARSASDGVRRTPSLALRAVPAHRRDRTAASSARSVSRSPGRPSNASSGVRRLRLPVRLLRPRRARSILRLRSSATGPPCSSKRTAVRRTEPCASGTPAGRASGPRRRSAGPPAQLLQHRRPQPAAVLPVLLRLAPP